MAHIVKCVFISGSERTTNSFAPQIEEKEKTVHNLLRRCQCH
uniref:Uncharacterized protein n=1 Tax=Anguilla anguilla TaxID=7936 RepID=A0A0E9V8I1_ANGAN